MGALLSSLAYLVTTAGRVGLLFYLPTEHRWSTTAPRGIVAMDWFARAAWTLLALGLGVAAGWALAPRLGDRSDRVARVAWQVAWLLLGWGTVFTVLWLIRG
jgi:hypothetical protein